ncbi:hypothetical protein ACFWY9_33140 [Amycolatopsis sp. NPDC059027]|uniref:hypothetical protein n=1 Tax=unclassified Amycolatopsis TaxID=2618356 RepID=UPI00366EFD2A
MSERVLYHEPGVGWIAVLWGPLFAVLGWLSELLLGGPVHTFAWILAGLALCAITAPWVYARRRYLSLAVTTAGYRQGRETVPAAEIAAVTDVGAPAGARVLGGGWAVPRKYDELPVKLTDGSVVLAWAKDAEALRDALSRLVGTGSAHDGSADEDTADKDSADADSANPGES